MQRHTLESQNSCERIRQLVKREGKTARNLVTWSVPAVDQTTTTTTSSCSSGQVSAPSSPKNDDISAKKPRKRNQRRVGGGGSRERKSSSPKPGVVSHQLEGREEHKEVGELMQNDKSVQNQEGTNEQGVVRPNAKGMAPVIQSPLMRSPLSALSDLALSEEMCKAAAAGHYGNRQLRVKKSPGRKVKDLHARYWSYLFDNLHRAVDEIYNTCETDESIVECQEVIMTLDNCRRDFVELIKRFELFERSDLQSSSSNLAWEVRKTTSPSKVRQQPLPYSRSHPRPPNLAKQQQHQSSLTSSLEQTQQRDATNSKVTDTSAATTCNTTPVSSNRSTPSSARVLDFGSSGRKRGRKVWSCEGNGSSASPGSNSNAVGNNSGLSQDLTTPTWADRVRGGVARGGVGCSPLGSSRPNPSANGNGGTNKPQSAPANGVREKKGLSSDRPNNSDATRGVDHNMLQTDRESEKREQDSTGGRQELKKEEKGEEEEGEESGWETVNNSRNQSRNNSATTVRREGATQSVKVRGLDSSKDEDHVSEDANKDNQPSSSSSEASPRHEVTCELSASPPSQVDLTSRSEDLSLANTDDSDQGLSIEDLASGAAAQLLLDNDGEEEKGEEYGVELKDISTDVGGTNTLSQGLSQASDKDSGWSAVMAEYEAGAGYRGSASWADRCESPLPSPPDNSSIVLPEVPRSPGRAIHLHQRLSSPSRKRPVDDVEESRRLQEEKQAKAQLQRSLYLEEKTQKSKLESDKIRGARERSDALIRQKKEALEGKLQRAGKKRESHLQEIKRKAQEEEAKVSEISFINTLEAQNKKIVVLEKYQVREARLQELQEERQRKKEEQQAKEEAAQERRRAKEAERQAKLMELQERRREQDAKMEQKRQEKEKAREEAARKRERKLEALNAAQQSSLVELTKKIQLRQDNTSRRYDQQLEQKKKAAADMTGSSRHASTDFAPRVEAYKKKKWCTICHVRIISEVYLMSHLRGRKHQEMLTNLQPSLSSSPETNPDITCIIEASEEHQGPPSEQPEVLDRIKAGKKRAKKLRHRMASRSKEKEEGVGRTQQQQQQAASSSGSGGTSSPAIQTKHRAKLQKALREFNKQVDSLFSSSHLGGAWDSTQLNQIDRSLGEMRRTLSGSGSNASDQLYFYQLGGLASVLKMLLLSSEPASNCGSGQQARARPLLPEKTFLLSTGVLQSACSGHIANSCHLLLSSKATALIDLSLQLLTEALPPKDPPPPPQQQQGGVAPAVGGAYGSKAIPICGPLLRLLASMISTLASGPLREDTALLSPLLDVISYMVSVGLIDRLGDHFNTIVGPIGETELTQLVLGGLNLLVATTACMHTRVANIFSEKPMDDPTLLTVVLKQTELVGLMQLLYAILLHDGPPRHSSYPPPLTGSTLSIATATIKTVNNCAIIDLKMMQACLGAEGISLEFRHIISYLLWYCSHFKNPALLHELILAIGYFCVLNHDNQVFLQSGRSPTLLQLLCGLPFEFFSNPEHTRLLFPTLISACYQVETNKQLLEQEISSKLLVTFLQENIARESSTDQAKLRIKGQEATTAMDKQQQQTVKMVDYGSLFEHRFPKSYWKDAVSFFTK